MRHDEDDLQREVCGLLQLYENRGDLTFFAVPNGGHRNKREAARLKGLGVRPGVADLVLVFDGHVIFLELKSAEGRQSDSQKAFHDRVFRLTHPYWICRSVAEVHANIDAFLEYWVRPAKNVDTIGAAK